MSRCCHFADSWLTANLGKKSVRERFFGKLEPFEAAFARMGRQTALRPRSERPRGWLGGSGPVAKGDRQLDTQANAATKRKGFNRLHSVYTENRHEKRGS